MNYLLPKGFVNDTQFISSSRSGILHLSTRKVSAQEFFAVTRDKSVPVHSKMCGNAPGLCPLDASSRLQHTPPLPYCDNQQSLHVAKYPCKAKSPQLDNHYSRSVLTLKFHVRNPEMGFKRPMILVI